MTCFYKYFFILLFFIAGSLFSVEKPIQRWAAYYSNKEPVEAFSPYQLVVFNYDEHPLMQGMQDKEIITLGYLSLGEVEKKQPYYEDVKKQGLLLGENPHWKGSFYVDVRNKLWQKRVIEELVPAILFQRFNGVFLDTLDDAEYLENLDPVKNKGIKQAAIDLVKAIRLHYPPIKIMVNRAYYMLPQVASIINYELGESIYSTYNYDHKKYELVSEKEYNDQVKLLNNAKKLNPNLQIFTLDYWDPHDVEGYKKIYNVQRAHGFIPYVATLHLDTLIPEPSKP